MGVPYTYTAYEDQVVPYAGRRIPLRQGQTWETESACQMLGFLGAVNRPVTEETATVAELRTACGAERAAASQQPPPAGAPVGAPAPGTAVTDGSADRPPVAPDSARQQGAPTVNAGGGVGTGTERRDQTPPESEQRRPPPGQPSAPHAGDRSGQRNEAGEPVDLFSGAFTVRNVDLEVPAALLPLRLVRTYRSGTASFGPFGWNWDHNYNVFLRVLADGSVVRWDGALHEDLFELLADGRFEPPRGVFERLERLPGPAHRMRLVLPQGETHTFEQPPGWPDAERIPLVAIADRHGNRQQLDYDAEGRLARVADDDGRQIGFAYEPCGIVDSVSDHAGRVVRYEYADDIQHLTGVRAPPTADFPAGEHTGYDYDHPNPYADQRHNVIRVLGDCGGILLENRYEPDPGELAYNRVVMQRFGDDVFSYSYESVQAVAARDEYVGLPARRTAVSYPDGSLTAFTFNFRGDMLDRRTRLERDGSFRIAFEQYEYDRHGNQTAVASADGGRVRNGYDVDSADPCARGNLLRVELFAAPTAPAPSRAIWRAEYEPSYQLLRESHTENGARTRYEYDFDTGAPGATGKLTRVVYPPATLPDGSVQTAERRYEHNARGQVTAELSPEGVRTELRYVAAGANRGRVEEVVLDAGGAAITESLAYDAYGFVLETTDGNGAVTRTVRNARGQLELHERPEVRGSRAPLRLRYGPEDHLARIERPAGEFSDSAVPAGGTLVDELEYDIQGRLVRLVLGASTEAPREFRMTYDHAGRLLSLRDAEGAERLTRYDERGLVLEETSRNRGERGPVMRWRYDRAGRLVRTILPDGQHARLEYDGFGRVTHLVRPDGADERRRHGADDVLASREVWGDPGGGGFRLLGRESHEYDERGRHLRRTVAAFAGDPALAVDLTTTFEHDADDRLVRLTDHRGAASTATFTGDRLTTQVDPEGNRVDWEYDAAGRMTARVVTHRERGIGRSRRWEYRYDARGRRTQAIEPDGTSVLFSFDDRDLETEVADSSGVVEHRTYGLLGELLRRRRDPGALDIVDEREFDLMGRVTGYRDPLGEMTRRVLDGLGREVGVVLPDGSAFSRGFGPDGRVATETTPNGVTLTYSRDANGRVARIAAAGGAGVDPVEDHLYSYDGLDRIVRASAGTSVVERHFDSLDRLVLERTDGAAVEESHDDLAGTVDRTFPDGRVERTQVDLLGRTTLIVEVGGGGLGGLRPDLMRVAYAGLHQWERIDLPGALVAEARYDDRQRLTDIEWRSGGAAAGSAAYRHDARGCRRVELLDGAPPLTRRARPDGAGRLVEVEQAFPEPSLGPADSQADHDAAIAAVAAAGAPGESTAYTLSTADDRVRETSDGSTTGYGYSPGHRLSSIDGAPVTAFPDGHRRSDPDRSYEIDAVGRLVRVRDSSGTLLNAIGYDALGRPASVADGPTTRALRYFGRLPVHEDTGGAPSRQWTHHPALGVPLIVHRPGAQHVCAVGGTLELLAVHDHSGRRLASYRYAPFGSPLAYDEAGSLLAAPPEEPAFAGMPFLAASGLYLTPLRAMDPATGLFLARDPYLFADSPSPFVYAGHAPLDRADPDGDLAFLVILGIIAVGALVGGGVSAARQGVGLATGERHEPFSWGEVGRGALVGGLLAPVVVVAPEVALPLAAFGLVSAANEARQGHWATAGFDAVLALAPFKSASVRGSVFGQGSRIGQLRGLGPAEALPARLARLDFPPGVRPPGVRVREVQHEGARAWEKTVATRVPGLRWWAELSIRAQSRGLRRLEAGGVRSARVLRDYEPGGALVTEDVGPLASSALRQNPALRPAYDSYFVDATRALGWPTLGRVPVLQRFLHDLRPENIGYSPERGFAAFDPALDPVTPIAGTVGGLAIAGVTLWPLSAHGAEPPRQPRIEGDAGGPAPASGDGHPGKH
jgi:RHS repeat-associated protein